MAWEEPPSDPDETQRVPIGPDETQQVPIGPEPELTGGAGSGGGPGGWGPPPRTEPMAIAAMVWAIVSLAVPVLGTLVALALSFRAADLIRRSDGERGGEGLVTGAQVVAGVGVALWAIGLIAYLALSGGGDTNNDVAV